MPLARFTTMVTCETTVQAADHRNPGTARDTTGQAPVLQVCTRVHHLLCHLATWVGSPTSSHLLSAPPSLTPGSHQSVLRLQSVVTPRPLYKRVTQSCFLTRPDCLETPERCRVGGSFPIPAALCVRADAVAAEGLRPSAECGAGRCEHSGRVFVGAQCAFLSSPCPGRLVLFLAERIRAG